MIQVQGSIVTMLRSAFEQYAEKDAYTCMGQSLSYKDLDRLSDCFAAWLTGQPELEAGDRIAIQLPNLLQYPVAVMGILKADMVIVNINPLYSPVEIEHQLNDAGVKVMLVLANTALNAAKVINKTEVTSVIVTEVADLHDFIKRTGINFFARYFKKGQRNFKVNSQYNLREVLKTGQKNLKGGMPIGATANSSVDAHERLAVLQYTGGTTGISKGAMLTHSNLLSNMMQFKQQLGEDCPKPGSVMIAPLPLYHIYAFTVSMMVGVYCGHQSVLIPNPRDITGFVKTLKSLKINGFIGINTLYDALCRNLNFSKLDFSSLRISSSAGMALSPKVAERWYQITNCKILEGYGLTETSPLVSCNTFSANKEGSSGKACLETQINILDKAGQILPPEQAGEIVIKGPQVMKAYWRQPEETNKVLDEKGWLRTGDIGVLDKDGFLTIVDRIKDLVIVSGFNVYPSEVEDYICSHPDISEAAVIGIKDGEVSEKLKLFVVTTSARLNKIDIVEYCRKGLAAYKVPRIIEFRQTLPKSNIGKVLRRELR